MTAGDSYKLIEQEIESLGDLMFIHPSELEAALLICKLSAKSVGFLKTFVLARREGGEEIAAEKSTAAVGAGLIDDAADTIHPPRVVAEEGGHLLHLRVIDEADLAGIRRIKEGAGNLVNPGWRLSWRMLRSHIII